MTSPPPTSALPASALPASPRPEFAAVVLTGGTGERMGGVDKAAVRVRGRTLLDHALAATHGAAQVVVAGHEVAVPEGVRVVREEPPGGGPAAGLLAARDALRGADDGGAEADWLVVWAVDMPRVTSGTVRRLLAAAVGRDGAVLLDADGRRQLCLAVSTARIDAVRPPAGAHGQGLFRLLAGLDLAAVAAVGTEAVDVDTWADLEAVATLGAMRAVQITTPGGPEVLTVVEQPDLTPGPGEVLVEVVATAVNKADTLQRRGFYPAPPGASEVPGLECSGRVAALGEGVEGWSVGDEVCALLSGGGYASQVLVPAGQLMEVPEGVDLVEAAALPEVACTVWSNVFMTAGLEPGESFLVHGGGGGIGTFAIQLASAMGSKVFTTAGSAEKLAVCAELGADVTINYREEDFLEVVREVTGGRGVDVVLDNMGAKYLAANVSALADDGRLVIIGMQGGVKAELNISQLLAKRGSVIATSLRARPEEQKAAICAEVTEHVWPLVTDGQVRPVIHEVMPLEEVARAHELMDSSGHVGKIVLTL